MTIACAGREKPSLVKEHIDAGTFEAIHTYCSRNPGITRVIDPGGAHYEYAIFNQVPATGNVALEWENYGVSQGVNPWTTPPYPPNAPHPTDCPSGSTCQSQLPEGTATNLIVLVHGCCTDDKGVYEWKALADAMIGEILKSSTPDAWEVVVWDWSSDTPPANVLAAYTNAEFRAADLANAISPYPYKYVHLIGHSAGARLIDLTAKNLAALYNNVPSLKRPFIHLTFLDAYTQNDKDSGKDGGQGYGYLGGYSDHYAEHYVDRALVSTGTDACLASAFNFDITGWTNANKGDVSGHQWPRYWYEQSVTTRSQTPSQTLAFAYGYPLSFEGGHNTYAALSEMYPAHLQCLLKDINTTVPVGCNPVLVPTDPAYKCW